ncbi:MAG: ribbon-helix-helix protein, CopG family [Calditrichaeota bacterium]|nr:ribbon-helix-helix protein, CopG family [Calditrichota bacterium]
MKTIQMTLDEELLKQVEEVIKNLKITRSAFIRESLKKQMERLRIQEMEEKHLQGYMKNPVKPGEFDVWEDEQDWGE